MPTTLNSEWIYEDINFPKYEPKNLNDFALKDFIASLGLPGSVKLQVLTSQSQIEAHASFFRSPIKRKFDVYLLCQTN